MRFVLLAVVLTFLGDTDPPENVAAFLAARDEQAAAEIKHLDSEIRRLVGDKRKNSRELLAKWRDERAALKKDSSTFVPQIPYRFCILKAGEIGRLAKPVITVIQIVDENDMIVEAVWTYDDYSAIGNELVGSVGKANRRLWLRGFPTGKLANDAKTTLDVPVEITGNHTYETVAGGTETLFVVEPFDMAKLEPYLKRKSKSKPRRKP